MQMTPTTFGTGPFQPAIKFDEKTFVHPDTFDSEDDSTVFANKLIDKCHDLLLQEIARAYFIFEL